MKRKILPLVFGITFLGFMDTHLCLLSNIRKEDDPG